MDREWTEAQKTAINSQSKNILVCAAAGSGKTAVLTERVLRKILAGADISRMLVVTFTKAAAAELRSRISSALADALANDPTNKTLARQISSLPSAKISTVDSFCYDIVKRNFDRLGLSCNVKIADETEIKLLFKKTMDSLFDEMYDNPELLGGFTEFTDAFISERDDSLPEVFIKLYNSLCSKKDGIDFIKLSIDGLNTEKSLPFFKTRAGIYTKECIRKFINHYYGPVKRGTAFFENGGKKEEKYRLDFLSMQSVLENASDALERDDYCACSAAFRSYSPINMSGGKALSSDDTTQFYKSIRETFIKDVKDLCKDFLIFSKQEIKDSYEKTASFLGTLYSLLSAFDKRINEEKKKRSIIDFADVERFALSILCKDGEPTQFAKEYSSSIDEVFVDEYQDINEVQDTIFRMVSTNCKRFMVGDIKQSIYGFRGSDPRIFANYRNSYKEDENPTDKKIFLSENFRCSKSVIDFTNTVFSYIMNLSESGIKYEKGDALVYPFKEEAPSLPVEFVLLKKNSTEELTETEYVAQRIKELIASGYSPNDIAVLFRSTKDKVSKMEDALNSLNVPYYSNVSRDFFENPEVLLAMCLLNTIDNPRRDVYLAGALRSPVFGFTLDDLVNIKSAYKNGCLYDALCEYAKNNQSEKCDYFFTWLEDMRTFARSKPIDKLLWHVYSTTSLISYSYASLDSEKKRANLMMLYEYARKFEASSFKGLYNFILYVNEIIKSDETMKEAKVESDAAPSVKLLSVHASKGLEFKVVFLCKCESPFNKSDTTANIVIDSELGCAMQLGDESGFGRYNTILRSAIKQKITDNSLEEEMRILYVALTRAKERLFVCASVSNQQDFMDKCEMYAKLPTEYSLYKFTSYAQMIMTALKSNGETDPCWRLVIPSNGEETGTNDPQKDDSVVIPAHDVPDYETCKKAVKEVLYYSYPYSILVNLPAKIAVSKLYPDILDETEERSEMPPALAEVPDSIETEKVSTAAEKGTATHLFLQFCDFDLAEKYGVEKEAQRLFECKYISERVLNEINYGELNAFFSSPLFAQMKNAKECRREFRFNVNFPAAEFSRENSPAFKDEKILVQGVIDCFIEDERGLKIIDYKTDRFSEYQMRNRENCRNILRERHSQQLGYYKKAIESLLSRPVYEISIYSLCLGEEIIL